MTLTEYIEVLHHRANLMEQYDAKVKAHDALRVVAEELERVEEAPDLAGLTSEEAAKLLSYTPAYVRELCRCGKFEGAVKLTEGGQWRIPRDDIRDYMACNKSDINLPSVPRLVD